MSFWYRTTRRSVTFLLCGVLVSSLVLPVAPAQAAVSSWQQKGVSYYPSSPTDFGSANFDTTVNQFKSLGFNTVTLIIQVYQSNDNSTDIGPGGNTPTDSSIVSAIQYVHSQGMKVMLDIHDDTPDGNWRANINPSDRTTWYTNYTAMLKHYGELAQANGVEAYCLGTEMIDMASANANPDNTQEWEKMIAQVRSVYSGEVTYDANWGGNASYDEVRGVQFWSALDFIGISAYYPLSGDGSVAQNESSWANWQTNEIGPIEQQWNKPIVFTEIGYRSVTNAYSAPYDSWSGGNYDPQGQSNDYQALLDFWNNYSYMQGIDVWYAVSDPNAGGSGNTDYLIQNKPVEQTIQSWFANGNATPSGPTTTDPAPTFTATGSASATTVSTGQPVTLTANITDTSGTGTGDIVDFEVYGGSNQVFQQYASGQNFSPNQSKAYTATWTPTANGTYTYKLGVFDGNWNNYAWNNGVAQIGVGTTPPPSTGPSTPPPTTSSSTPPSNPTMDIWWPTDGTTLSGVQPFKGLLENTPLDSYTMFWQVDGGQLNQMSDNQAGYPHKEFDVDVTSWTWHGSGPYNITFIAKDTNNNVLTQKSMNINVAN